MTTMTAQILVGHSHPDQGGINPTHWLYLSQKSCPTWILSEENILDINEEMPIEWRSSEQYLIQDAILLIGVCVLNDKVLKEMIKTYSGQTSISDKFDLSNLSDSHREQLASYCKEKHYHYKMIVSIFGCQSLDKCENILRDYHIDAEVCYSNKMQ